MADRRGTSEGRALGAGDAVRFRLDAQALNQLLNGTDGPVAKDLARRCIKVERAAKRLCPVDTGRLRASITWRLGRDGIGLHGVIGTNVRYAMPVEFRQPFLRPALEAAR